MKLEILKTLWVREERICRALRQAADMGGATGEAAELLETILLPHLSREPGARDLLDFPSVCFCASASSEEVFYPAALFVRNHLRLRAGKEVLKRPSAVLT